MYFKLHYNILNIVVNTEHEMQGQDHLFDYNILNIVVNTELVHLHPAP